MPRAVLARRGRFDAAYHTPVELGGMYWHLVDAVWVFLVFPLAVAVEGTAQPVVTDYVNRRVPSAQRATVLYQLIFTDDALESGFEELRANPPAPGQPIEPDLAKATAEVILKFWYADLFAGRPLPDRGSAYYQMTSWQAMYTFSWAVCHFYGGWADEPSSDPLIPANSVS